MLALIGSLVHSEIFLLGLFTTTSQENNNNNNNNNKINKNNNNSDDNSVSFELSVVPDGHYQIPSSISLQYMRECYTTATSPNTFKQFPSYRKDVRIRERT